MALISGKYKHAANIASMDVVVEHCAFLEPAASRWFLDVRCRSGKQEWNRLCDACPEAKVVVKSNDILVSLPPLPEELELTVFGKPGECDMKRMQLCTFGRKPVIGKDWVISVYLCDDTVMAFENVHKREEIKGNKLLTTRTGLFVANSDDDIKISVNTLETGWQIKGSDTKTIKSRNAWNSPENATDFPCLKFEVCHVDEMKQSFFCGITASHGTDIAEAEIRAFFEQKNEKADSLNISNDLFKGCEEFQANDNRTGYPGKNHRSLPVRTFFIIIETFSKDIPLVLCSRRDLEIEKSPHVKPAAFATKTRKKKTIPWFNVVMLVLICFMEFSKDFKPGTQAEEMKDNCPREKMKLMCPHLKPAIKSGDYKKFLWTVSDPVMKSKKQSLVYCDEHLKCDGYTLEIFATQIEIRSTEQPMSYVEQLTQDELVIFLRYIRRKQNESPLIYQMNVYSSVNCLSTVAGQDVNLNQALTFGCYIEQKQKKPALVYQINVSSSVNYVGHVSATFTCPRNGTLHDCLKKYRCTYVPGTEEGNIIGSAEGGSKFCNDTMSCQWKGNTVFF